MTASFTYGAEVLGQIEEEKGLQVIYHANGGSGADDRSGTVRIKNTIPFRLQTVDLSITAWNLSAGIQRQMVSGTTYLPGDKFYITETTELYAIWKKVSNPTTEKPSTEKPSPTPSDKPKDVVIGKIYPVGKARYKVTSKKAVMLVSLQKAGSEEDEYSVNGPHQRQTVQGDGNRCKCMQRQQEADNGNDRQECKEHCGKSILQE